MTSKEQFNKWMDQTLDHLATTTDDLGDIRVYSRMSPQVKNNYKFIDSIIDYADHYDVYSICDFRVFWYSLTVQNFLDSELFKNSCRRLAAVWVREKLCMDPVRNEVIDSIWSHL